MKKVHLLSLITFMIAGSCNEQVDFKGSNLLTPNLPFLSFGSEVALEAAANSIVSMSDPELDDWEKSQGFVSYRTVFNEANEEWQKVESEGDKQLFLKKYGDILTIENNELVPNISIRLYQAIVNREGIYETCGFLNKVAGDLIVTVAEDEYYKLFGVSTSGKGVAVGNGVRSFKFIGETSDLAGRTNAACSTEMTASYFHNESNCRHDREVFISARSYVVLTTNSTGDYRQPRVEIKVWGKIRSGTWCNWSNYSTTLAYRNVSFTITAWQVQDGVASPTSYSRVLPDYAPVGDRSTLPWDQPIGDRVHNQIITPYAFTSFHGEGSSRGVEWNWAILDCQ